MLGYSANKALITGMKPVVSAFSIALQVQLWVPAVNIYVNIVFRVLKRNNCINETKVV